MEETYAEKLKNIEADKISLDELKDIRYSLVNAKLHKENKMLEYLEYIKNPFLYKYKKYKVRTFFQDINYKSDLEKNLLNFIDNF